MPTIAEGVDFDTIAREWRCKWSHDNDDQSLVDAQKAISSLLAQVKAVDGVKSVQRVVCGGCLDFKIVVALSVDAYHAWKEAGHEPEEAFLDALKAIDGISRIETQTYTLMPL